MSIGCHKNTTNNCVLSDTVFEYILDVDYINTINYLETIKCYFVRNYNAECMNISVLPLTNDNNIIHRCFKPPDCLLGVVSS